MPAILDHTTLTDGSDADAVYTAFVEWAESTGISLYPAQDEAVIEIVSGNNLILSTPTGTCLLYTSPSPRDKRQSRMPSSA